MSASTSSALERPGTSPRPENPAHPVSASANASPAIVFMLVAVVCVLGACAVRFDVEVRLGLAGVVRALRLRRESQSSESCETESEEDAFHDQVQIGRASCR